LQELFTAGQNMLMEADREFVPDIGGVPAVRFVNSLLATGVVKRASDIHIEPAEDMLRVRYRVDGQLMIYRSASIAMLENVISRLKVLANMDIAERRLPQDGHFTDFFDGVRVEFRVSTLPTTGGEKAVIRLLFGQNERPAKTELGFYEDDLARLDVLFSRPHGAVFITGPTGCGKSTTLSAFLAEMDAETLNIITVEDPVEHPLSGVNHVSIERSGMGFAGALKHILRQDPDVIMIGEIRDEETARIAIQAAITGHVVLSTLHTNDAAGVIERLLDMGTPAYLAASAINGVVSQRLVRKLCEECAEWIQIDAIPAGQFGVKPGTKIRTAVGCPYCNSTGYRGRFAIYEYIILDENARREMAANPAGFAVARRKVGGMLGNALRALKSGKTTLEELIKALGTEVQNEQ
jgi:type II secretory ATPase GspE/PulE/Tfp pilus assembly ATPase PilB-like protein